MRSCGVNFEKSEVFKSLRGPKGGGGGPPKKFQILFLPKNRQPCYMKNQIIKYCVCKAKNTIISCIGLGGGFLLPQVIGLKNGSLALQNGTFLGRVILGQSNRDYKSISTRDRAEAQAQLQLRNKLFQVGYWFAEVKLG